MKRKLGIAFGLLAAFILWTLAVSCADVQIIGPRDSAVGFATVNGWFHSLTGVDMTLYHITDWLGLVPVAFGFGFAILGLAAGTTVLTVFGSAFNAIYLLPKFAQLYGIPLESIIKMGSDINSGISSVSTFVLWAVAPLNLIKGLSISALTMLLYKRLSLTLTKLKI